jgi:hypothetical protein
MRATCPTPITLFRIPASKKKYFCSHGAIRLKELYIQALKVEVFYISYNELAHVSRVAGIWILLRRLYQLSGANVNISDKHEYLQV